MNKLLLTAITIWLATGNLAIAQIGEFSDPYRVRFNVEMYEKRFVVTPLDSKESVTLVFPDRTETLEPKNGRVFVDFETDAAGKLVLVKQTGDSPRLFHLSRNSQGKIRIRSIPLWMSIIPPLLAIAAAFLFREVVVSMFLGLWSGAILIGGLRFDSLYYLLRSPLTVVDTYVLNALNDSGHLSVIVFSMLIGGVVAVTSRNGGMTGIANVVSSLAKSARGSMVATWLLGIVIFFDDYANTLIVGNTMRPITDRYKVSREKLAFIVDCTAAPIAAVAFISTWIGAELGYIKDGLDQIGDFEDSVQPYSIFLASLKYACYPAMMLLFTLFVILVGRDFGPMLTAEQKTDSDPDNEKKTEPKPSPEAQKIDIAPAEAIPHRWWNGAIPLIVLITMTMYGLVETSLASFAAEAPAEVLAETSCHWKAGWIQIGNETGENSGFMMKLGKLMGAADSYQALIWSSLTALIVAVLLSVPQKLLSLDDAMLAMLEGFRLMLPACLILVLAWALSSVVQQLHTAEFLTLIATDRINPRMLPLLVFLLSAVTAFMTGSSWSTMAILYPLVIPLTWSLVTQTDFPVDSRTSILLNVVAVTLSGAVMGDHCSPISDTTILSSMASECHHLAHVRTQLPYALLVGGMSAAFATVTGWLAAGWFISLVTFLVCFAILILSFQKISSPIRR